MITQEESTYLQRDLINARLSNLNSIPIISKPTKMDLFQKRRMMGRVQRIENRRFQREIAKQQKDLTQRKSKISTYLVDLEKEKARRAQILADYYAPKDEEKEIVPLVLTSPTLPIFDLNPVPTFSALPTFDLKSIRKFPVRIKTRIQSKKRLRRVR